MRRVQVLVVGGGITGQLVQFHVPEAAIVDWMPAPSAERRNRETVTRNWGTNYLWKPLDGLKCKKFPVITHIDQAPATYEAAKAYKAKVGKPDDLDHWEEQFQLTMTGYEFAGLPEPRIDYDHRIVEMDLEARLVRFARGKETVQYDTLVSTIPLSSLVNLANVRVPGGPFRNRIIYIHKSARPPDAPCPEDVLYVNYLSSPTVKPYRFCDRLDGERHYESLEAMGVPAKVIVPGKIYPHPYVGDILDRLKRARVVTFGRFGSWNPDELVHDTWDRIVAWKQEVAC